MIWLSVVVAVIIVLALVGALASASPTAAPPDRARYKAAVDLHGIRRRQEVAELKREVKRDASEARRELREELGGLTGRERKS
jgi:hypothetical protein